jgi:CHAT domain
MFNVLISLTKNLQTPEVHASNPGPGTLIAPDGLMKLPLPDASSYTIDVVLMSRDFDVIGSDSAQIQMDRDTDSTPARFELKPRAEARSKPDAQVQATFWYQGRYLARASRPIAIGTPMTAAPAAAAPEAVPVTMNNGDAPPDMTIFHLEQGSSCRVIIVTRYEAPAEAPCVGSRDLAPWLDAQYRKILAASGEMRGFAVPSSGGPNRQEAKALLEGFGRQLYQRFAPALFQHIFWQTEQRHPGHFHSIQIFTDNPLLPWELMIPVSPDGTALPGFLGTEFQIARWHIQTEPGPREIPPNRLRLEKVTIIAPRYQGATYLPSEQQEIDALRRMPGAEVDNGQFTTIADVLRNPPQGIVHFIGHGMAETGPHGVTDYAIRLEDRTLDLMTWRGLTARASPSHPLYFLNACMVGQAGRVAHFVDGWAPAVLESGASGFIGGIWPVSDAAAADLASRFYGSMEEQLRTGSAVVPELLRQVRRRFFETQDPTYLAYVFYGDVRLRVEKN